MDTHTLLSERIETLLVAAQPRLERLARRQGVTPEAVDDVVQETLIEAWRSLDHLRDAERFEAWLSGICRNVCLRWTHKQGLLVQRQIAFSDLAGPQEGEDATVVEVPDFQILDPVEELSRQELPILLDRAMQYLPNESRRVLELYHIAELPQKEIALQFGLSINALEVRLYRARKQLRQVLSNQLRCDGADFDLALDGEDTSGWRETSIWCFVCGRQHLRGMFEQLPDGNSKMRLRCPTCSTTPEADIVNTLGMGPLTRTHSFRPALKRALTFASSWIERAATIGYMNCPLCQQVGKVHGIEALPILASLPLKFFLVLECSSCGLCASGIISYYLSYPAITQFMNQYPRMVVEPEVLVEYKGQSAIRLRFVDILSSSRLTAFVYADRLGVIDTFLE